MLTKSQALTMLLGCLLLQACTHHTCTPNRIVTVDCATMSPDGASFIPFPGAFSLGERYCETRSVVNLPPGSNLIALLIDEPPKGWSAFHTSTGTRVHLQVRLRSGKVVLDKQYPIMDLYRQFRFQATTGPRLLYGAGVRGSMVMWQPPMINMRTCSPDPVFLSEQERNEQGDRDYPSTLLRVPPGTDCDISVCIVWPDSGLRDVTAHLGLYVVR